MAKGSDDILAASTKFRYKGEEVSVSIFVPCKEFADSGEYSCRFSIKGGEIEYSGRSIGFDSMQSLMLTMTKIGNYLEYNDEFDCAQMEWEGGVMIFPTFSNS